MQPQDEQPAGAFFELATSRSFSFSLRAVFPAFNRSFIDRFQVGQPL